MEQPPTPEPQQPSPEPPPYPTAPPPPSYPTASAPPQYPAPAPPPYPTDPAPQLPSTPTPPAYPTPPAPPQYPGGSTAPAPATPPPPPYAAPPRPPYVPPQAHPRPPAQPPHLAPAPDDLDYRHRGSRVHVAQHQRGADATAVGRLLLNVPALLVSLAVVSTIAVAFLGSTGGLVAVLAWLASGALVFHRPTELAFARHVLGLRPLLADERVRLDPVWREVTARAGIEAHSYELMVENSDEINASAVAGHVVGVTTYALKEIPSSALAAVLAHELGHHTGGHAWAGLLGYWYSLPARIAWGFTKLLALIALKVAGVFSIAATGILLLFMAVFVIVGFLAMPYITVPLALAPFLLAYMSRKGELRADQQAADLGFAGQMTQVLHQVQASSDAHRARAMATGRRPKKPGGLSRLLSTHPDTHTRIRALEPYLRTGL